MNNGLVSIIFSFLFLILFYFILSFIFSFFILDLGGSSGVTSHVTVTQVTKYDRDMTPITVTLSCDTKKIIESSKIDNIIQYGNNMLTLWKAHVL